MVSLLYSLITADIGTYILKGLQQRPDFGRCIDRFWNVLAPTLDCWGGIQVVLNRSGRWWTNVDRYPQQIRRVQPSWTDTQGYSAV